MRRKGISCFFSCNRALQCTGLALLLAAVPVAVSSQSAESEKLSSSQTQMMTASSDFSRKSKATAAQAPETDVSFIGAQSFGHFHVYVSSWWSNLAYSGVEMNRHVWGRALGARLDYSADFLPVMILRQPTKADVWGNPLTKDREIVYGIGISPIGARLLWREDKRFKPYFQSKGGIAAFSKKATSPYAAYENFTLQFAFGSQIQVSPRWDGRVGFNYFHISDAFIVPSNPGLDSAMYTFGVTYHPGAPRR